MITILEHVVHLLSGCGKTFLTEVELESHKGVHDSTRDIVTANGYRFPQPIVLHKVDGTRGFACPLQDCDVWSTKRTTIVDHLNDHAGCKPYPCTQEG